MREGYKMSDVGVIPEDWKVKRLEEVATVIMGQSPSSDSYNEDKDGLPFFQGNSEFGRIFPTVKKWCNKPLKIAKPLDILISVRAPVGAVNINVESSCIGRGLGAVRAEENMNYRYLYYSLIESEKVLNSSAQGSTFTAINSGELKNLKIKVPNLKEQEKIAGILSTVDSQIDDTEKLIEKSKELKKGLMQKLLTKGIGHSEFKKTEIGEIPASWEVKKLRELGNYYNGLTGKTKSDFENGNCKFITYSNVNLNTFVDLESLGSVCVFEDEKQNCVKYGDIIFTGSSENPEEAGMTSIFINDIDNIYLNSFCFGYRLNNILDINPKFLAYYLRGEEFRKNMFPLAQGSTRYNISKIEVMNLEVVVPSANEQEKISQILLSVDNEIEIYENKKQKLEEMKKGLMKQLLTGKVRAI